MKPFAGLSVHTLVCCVFYFISTYLSKSSIIPSGQDFVYRVNQILVKYWSLDLRLMRVYTCLQLDFCIEDIY